MDKSRDLSSNSSGSRDLVGKLFIPNCRAHSQAPLCLFRLSKGDSIVSRRERNTSRENAERPGRPMVILGDILGIIYAQDAISRSENHINDPLLRSARSSSTLWITARLD
jgi:hypothetical protein